MTNRKSKYGRPPGLPKDDSAPREFLRLLARRVIQRLKNRASTARKQNNAKTREGANDGRNNEA